MLWGPPHHPRGFLPRTPLWRRRPLEVMPPQPGSLSMKKTASSADPWDSVLLTAEPPAHLGELLLWVQLYCPDHGPQP